MAGATSYREAPIPKTILHPGLRQRSIVVKKKGLLAVMVLSVGWIAPAFAEDYTKFNFNLGGGMSAPVNPIAKYVGLSGNFTVGAGYNLNKNNSIAGEFLWNGLPPNTV